MNSIIKFYFILIPILNTVDYVNSNGYDQPTRFSLTISARLRKIEVSWQNIKSVDGDFIVITNESVLGQFKRYRYGNNSESSVKVLPLSGVIEDEGSGDNANFTNTSIIGLQELGSGESYESAEYTDSLELERTATPFVSWVYGLKNSSVLYETEPKQNQGWITTGLKFNNQLVKKLSVNSTCYNYWAYVISKNGTVLHTTCLRVYPRWMNTMRDVIGNQKLRDLFIPGTHDSASYRDNFHLKSETLVTKYSLTQDDNIMTQLIHGIRYLDIRVGFYKTMKPQFWANHGISKQQPLDYILQQVRDFVLETNEIVIFDVQEFPVGFRKMEIHRFLVKFIHDYIGELMVLPNLSWNTSLKNIWQQNKNIIVSYDKENVVREFPNLLFPSVEQGWANTQTLTGLKRYLSYFLNKSLMNFSSRPNAHMAEFTPDAWGVITDRYGGLRLLADDVNRHVSNWYANDWGAQVNIVAVDFYRGTTIVESAMYWNTNKEFR